MKSGPEDRKPAVAPVVAADPPPEAVKAAAPRPTSRIAAWVFWASEWVPVQCEVCGTRTSQPNLAWWTAGEVVCLSCWRRQRRGARRTPGARR